MTTITPSPSGASTSATTTTFTVPQFTPDAGCFDSDNIWYQESLCWPASRQCGFFHLNDELNYGNLASRKNCRPSDPSRYPQTVCPEAYTAVMTEDAGGKVDEGTTTARVEVVCCPTAYDFTYESASLKILDGTETATLDMTTCVVRTPSFSDVKDDPTITVRAWGSMNSAGDYPLETITTTFNPSSHVLVAEPVTIAYDVVSLNPSSTRTCAPDCDNPWTGGQWPLPTSDPPPEQTWTSDSPLRDAGKSIGMLVGIPVGCVVFLVLALFVGYRIWKAKNRRKEAAALRLEEGKGTATTAVEVKD